MTPHLAVKKLLLSTAIGFASIITLACSPIKTLNALVPNDTYQLHADIAYGNLSRQKIEVYQPIRHAESNKEKPPVIFFIMEVVGILVIRKTINSQPKRLRPMAL